MNCHFSSTLCDGIGRKANVFKNSAFLRFENMESAGDHWVGFPSLAKLHTETTKIYLCSTILQICCPSLLVRCRLSSLSGLVDLSNPWSDYDKIEIMTLRIYRMHSVAKGFSILKTPTFLSSCTLYVECALADLAWQFCIVVFSGGRI